MNEDEHIEITSLDPKDGTVVIIKDRLAPVSRRVFVHRGSEWYELFLMAPYIQPHSKFSVPARKPTAYNLQFFSVYRFSSLKEMCEQLRDDKDFVNAVLSVAL